MVTATELKAMLHDGDEIAVLDVREAGQFGEGHLLFATPLPYSRLELDIHRLVPRFDVRLIVCDDGQSSLAQRCTARLAKLGYQRAAMLEGGTRAWSTAGFALFRGVNVPSKTFGELVEHTYRTPHISAQELAGMQSTGEDFVVLDGRPYAEYTKMNIPGGVCCPNGELAYRAGTMVREPTTKIIVNCAGRTRSILGAQTLINCGVPNPVFALENGTQGWYLADYKLEKNGTRRYPDAIDPATLPGARKAAQRLMQRFGVREAAANEVARWLADTTRTTYVFDVGTPEEFAARTLAGAVHAPGGQLIQATDQWVAVRHARIVLVDSDGVRAPVVGSWLAQLGYEPIVLMQGIDAPLQLAQSPKDALPQLPAVPARAFKQAIDQGAITAVDLRNSQDYRRSHVPGSRWSIRPRIVEDLRDIAGLVALIAPEPAVAQLAATELIAAGHKDVCLLERGMDAWAEAGYATETSPDMPRDAECIDHLFFVHDRHAGNRKAMRQYLVWETGLLAQLDDKDRSEFRLPTA